MVVCYFRAVAGIGICGLVVAGWWPFSHVQLWYEKPMGEPWSGREASFKFQFLICCFFSVSDSFATPGNPAKVTRQLGATKNKKSGRYHLQLVQESHASSGELGDEVTGLALHLALQQHSALSSPPSSESS
eukprot:2508642-Amphidinium_carterae.2